MTLTAVGLGWRPLAKRTATVGDWATDAGPPSHYVFLPLALARQINRHDLFGLLPAFPVLGFCFGSTIMLVAAPQIVLLLLSRRAGDWGWFGVNLLVLIPFIYAATVFAVARFARRSDRKMPRNASLAILAASLTVAIVFGPYSLYVTRNLFPPHSSINAQRQGVGLIPAGARVSATDHLALQVAARRYVYVFPVLAKADWVLADFRDDALPDMSYIRRRVGISVGVNDLYWQPKLMRREMRLLERSRRWRLVYQRDQIYVFRRNLAAR
jgi:hypothetical protein